MASDKPIQEIPHDNEKIDEQFDAFMREDPDNQAAAETLPEEAEKELQDSSGPQEPRNQNLKRKITEGESSRNKKPLWVASGGITIGSKRITESGCSSSNRPWLLKDPNEQHNLQTESESMRSTRVPLSQIPAAPRVPEAELDAYLQRMGLLFDAQNQQQDLIRPPGTYQPQNQIRSLPSQVPMTQNHGLTTPMMQPQSSYNQRETSRSLAPNPDYSFQYQPPYPYTYGTWTSQQNQRRIVPSQAPMWPVIPNQHPNLMAPGTSQQNQMMQTMHNQQDLIRPPGTYRPQNQRGNAQSEPLMQNQMMQQQNQSMQNQMMQTMHNQQQDFIRPPGTYHQNQRGIPSQAPVMPYPHPDFRRFETYQQSQRGSQQNLMGPEIYQTSQQQRIQNQLHAYQHHFGNTYLPQEMNQQAQQQIQSQRFQVGDSANQQGRRGRDQQSNQQGRRGRGQQQSNQQGGRGRDQYQGGRGRGC